MKFKQSKKWFVFLLLPLTIACNTHSVAESSKVAETPSAADNGGKTSTRMETMTGAQPEISNSNTEVATPVKVEGNATEINWIDFETAIDLNKENKKFIFIDMYTDWCGWCKKMDASTFKNPSVINYIDKHFYAVKMNPESKGAVAYKEVLYEQKQYGNKMYNELSYNLLAGKMSFPSFIILNKREVKRGTISGYQTENQLISSLKHYVE